MNQNEIKTKIAAALFLVKLPAIYDSAGAWYALAERVALDNLFRLVAVDDSVQAVKGPTAHEIADPLFFNPEPLDLIVDVKEERIVARRIIGRPDKKTARSSYLKDSRQKFRIINQSRRKVSTSFYL